MSSLADLPELVGFFSYSRRDDENSRGALSRLRAHIQSELRLQLGRDFRLWQDTAAIPDGALWEDEIKRAVAESVFFIPIVTPSAVGSQHCRFEFQSFLARESALGRNDLIFPILYIRVPALESEAQWRQDDLLKIIGSRQYTDWQKFRHRDPASPEIAERVEVFCRNILTALHRPWISPQEQQKAEETREQAERERISRDVAWKQQAQEQQKLEEVAAEQTEARLKADEERQKKEESERRKAQQRDPPESGIKRLGEGELAPSLSQEIKLTSRILLLYGAIEAVFTTCFILINIPFKTGTEFFGSLAMVLCGVAIFAVGIGGLSNSAWARRFGAALCLANFFFAVLWALFCPVTFSVSTSYKLLSPLAIVLGPLGLIASGIGFRYLSRWRAMPPTSPSA